MPKRPKKKPGLSPREMDVKAFQDAVMNGHAIDQAISDLFTRSSKMDKALGSKALCINNVVVRDRLKKMPSQLMDAANFKVLFDDYGGVDAFNYRKGVSDKKSASFKANKIAKNAPTYKLECKICMAAEVETIFRPCAHGHCCEACAAKLTSTGAGTCPVCNSAISHYERVYL